MVSVLMGVLYKNKDISKLKTSIESILYQTYNDFELLICDDGSNDIAKDYLDEISKKDNRVKLIRYGNKFHLAEKLNVCIKEAKGKYIARMDDDDYSHSKRLEKQVIFLDKNPKIAFVGTNVNLVCENKNIGTRKFPEYPQVKDFYFTQPYIHPTILFRRDAIEMVNGYSEDKYCILCEDYDLFLRLYAEGYKGANLQEILFDYTLSTNIKGNRKFKHRINESVTRYRRFKQLGCLTNAIPYIFKPLVVGILPENIIKIIKKMKKIS